MWRVSVRSSIPTISYMPDNSARRPTPGAHRELRFPRCDLIGVDVELLRKLSQCSIALNGGKRHLCLEIRCVVPAFRRGRLLIVSPDSRGTACPLSGRNSTYRPVQISEAGSSFSVSNRNKNYCNDGYGRQKTNSVV
jgi:hypothetical protein